LARWWYYFWTTWKENYSKQLPVSAKRTAVRQALSLKNQAGNLFVIESFECKEGKVSETKKLLDKIGAQKSVLIVVSHKDELVERATRNLQGVKAVHAMYLNVRDILDADKVVISEKAVEIVSEWLKKTPNTSQATEGKK
jgi:large subunit ribosomal protein L4